MSRPIVAIVGRPNVGKSTLVNRIAQTSDAIVHQSRGVTRDRSYHVADWNGHEFMLVDTGGIEPMKSDDVFATSIRDQALQSRGVTRDRSYHVADWNGHEFMLVDTGGIEPMKSDDVFATSIRDQALAAAEEAAVILFVVDGSVGVTEEDESVARMVRKLKKPTFLLVNKLDNPARENDSLWEFYSLGVGEPVAVSALHGHGTGDLLDEVVALLPEDAGDEDDEPDTLRVAIIGRPNAGKSSLFNKMIGNDRLLDEVVALLPEDAGDEDDEPDTLRVAIIGRPNAGKSSLFNKMIGNDRSIVSNIAGTTRDAIDTVVERNGKRYRMVDTAGIRKKSTVYENIEYYSMVRGLRAIDRADVALLVVDASTGVTEQDQKVANLAIERGCALVVLLNKWDLLKDDYEREAVLLVVDASTGVTEQDQKVANLAIERGCALVVLLNKWDLLKDDYEREAVMETVDRRLTMAPWAEYLRISAMTGRSVHKIWDMVDAAAERRASHITTSQLNRLLTDMREFGHTVSDGKRRLKMHYVTQTGEKPPAFTFFVNHTDLVTDNYWSIRP